MFWLFWQIVGVLAALMVIGLITQLGEGVVETWRDWQRWRDPPAVTSDDDNINPWP